MSSLSLASISQNPSSPSTEELLALNCRRLYFRLISSFSLDPAVFITLMGLWVYFERLSGETQLIFLLRSLPPNMLTVFVDESVLVLQCVLGNDFTQAFKANNTIPCTQKLTNTFLTLGHLFHSRRDVLRCVQKMVEEVCWPALSDIYTQVVQDRAFATGAGQAAWNSFNTQLCNIVPHPQSQTQTVPQHQGQQVPGGPVQQVPITGFPQNQAHAFSEFSLNSVVDGLNRMNVNAPNEVHAVPETNSARLAASTLVLIFGAGQLISKWELTEFFNRTFGTCVHAIHLQEVASTSQQPLQVRVILTSPSFVEEILGRDDTALFNVNGKRAWAYRLASNNVIPAAASSSGEPRPSSPASSLVAGVITRVLD